MLLVALENAFSAPGMMLTLGLSLSTSDGPEQHQLRRHAKAQHQKVLHAASGRPSPSTVALGAPKRVSVLDASPSLLVLTHDFTRQRIAQLRHVRAQGPGRIQNLEVFWLTLHSPVGPVPTAAQ
jgi:hypothetical protein